MKETTKKKLKKVAKVLAIVLGGVFATIGVICSAALLSKCGSAADQKNPVVLTRREVVEVERGMSPEYTFPSCGIYDWSSTRIQLKHSGSSDIIAWTDLPLGEYVLKVDGPIYLWTSVDEGQVENCLTALNNASTDTDYESTYSIWATQEIPFVTEEYSNGCNIRLSINTSHNGIFLLLYKSVTYTLSFNNALSLSSLLDVEWPYNWFPWQALGTSASNPFIVSVERGSLDNPVYVVRFDGFLFTCNGKLYDAIEIQYGWAGYNGSNWTDGNGTYFTISGNNATLWTIDFVRYCWGQEYDLVMTPSVYPSENGNWGVPTYGPVSWASPAFRNIRVIWFSDPARTYTTPTGTYTLRQWIEIIMNPSGGSLIIEGGGTVGEPFDLFSNAFTSVLPILSINVLPNISLGLLLFLPIIAGIIVVIVRVVKK